MRDCYVPDLIRNDAACLDAKPFSIDPFGVDFSGCELRPTILRHQLMTASTKLRERVSRSDVELRLLTAMKTLRALPDRERRFFIVKSSSPDYVQESVTAYAAVEDLGPRFQPSPADISDCLHALAWVRHLELSAWRILWWRSFDLSFGVIGKQIGRSDETARKRFETAVTDAWIAANCG